MSSDDLSARARDVAGEMLIEARPDVAPLLTELADRIDNDALTLAEDERTMRRLADAIDRLETRTREDQMRADIWRDREDRYEQTIKGLEVELHDIKTERDAALAALERVRADERKEAWDWFMTILNDHYLVGQPVHDLALETYRDPVRKEVEGMTHAEEAAKALIAQGVAALVKRDQPVWARLEAARYTRRMI